MMGLTAARAVGRCYSPRRRNLIRAVAGPRSTTWTRQPSRRWRILAMACTGSRFGAVAAAAISGMSSMMARDRPASATALTPSASTLCEPTRTREDWEDCAHTAHQGAAGGARHQGDIDMTVLRVMASRHSAFYSPLLGAIAGGFLQEEGFEPVYAPLPPGKTVAQLLVAGEIDVAQSAVSSSWGPLEHGQQPPTVHFAQINARDGFLIAARHPDAAFSWEKLLSGPFMFVHGGQPQAMLAYAMHKQGVDFTRVQAVNAGASETMMAA